MLCVSVCVVCVLCSMVCVVCVLCSVCVGVEGKLINDEIEL